ncbi:hypothetical protein ACS0TY_003037 [Phlomoides rotata]
MRNCNIDLQSNASSSSMGSCTDHNHDKIINGDATELQAIYILWVARREMEEEWKNVNPESLQVQVHGNRGLSLKRSLQKFLQRRKDRRIQASMPYKH